MSSSPGGVQANARHPFQLLPYEIVSEILIFAWNLLPPLSRRRFDFPCVTALVCKCWKHITYDTPAVWSTVLVFYPWTEDCSKVGRRLGQSIPCPIDVVFSDSARSNQPVDCRLPADDQQSPLESLVQEIATNRTRIWSLQINIQHTKLSGVVYKELIGSDQDTTRGPLTPPILSSPLPPLTPVSLLRHLTIQSSVTADWSVYINVPFMRTITCDHPLANLNFTSPQVPSKAFGRLTKLNIEDYFWHTGDGRSFISILEQNPGLEVLSTPLICLMDHGVSVEMPIQLPSLYFLRICYNRTYLGETILSAFNTPNLRDLVLEVSCAELGSTRATRVGSTLRFCAAFHITNGILRYLSSITHLTLIHCNSRDLVELIHQIDTFDMPPTMGFPTPKLHTLATAGNSLALIAELIRVRPSIMIVQVLSEDLCWVPPKTSMDLYKRSDTIEEYQAHLEWIKGQVQVEIWGPSFEEFYRSLNLEQKQMAETSKSWLVSWSSGLTWIDQTDVWRGEVP